MLLKKESVMCLKEKSRHWFSYFQIYLNIIFDNFGIWLLGYRIEFSCLYIPLGLHFISTLWLWFWFRVKVHLKSILNPRFVMYLYVHSYHVSSLKVTRETQSKEHLSMNWELFSSLEAQWYRTRRMFIF